MKKQTKNKGNIYQKTATEQNFLFKQTSVINVAFLGTKHSLNCFVLIVLTFPEIMCCVISGFF